MLSFKPSARITPSRQRRRRVATTPHASTRRLKFAIEFAAIGQAEIEGWLACFRQALDETVPQAQLRDLIWQNVERLGHHMRNREG